MAKRRAIQKLVGIRRYQIFVSHATSDKWLATTICQKLEEAGATTFRDDRDINGGDDIPDRLRREIMRSDEMVVLLTPDSVNRPWVLLEVGGAWMRGMRITPILCHFAVDGIPEMIRSKKAIQLNEFDSFMESIRQRLTSR